MMVYLSAGAGVSAESGLGTFTDEDGLWSRLDQNEVATPTGLGVGFWNAVDAGGKR